MAQLFPGSERPSAAPAGQAGQPGDGKTGGHTVQYLTLIACSLLLTLAADRAFGSGTLTRPRELKTPARRGAVAASFQLRGDHVAMRAFDDLGEMAQSASRWLSETTWQEKDLRQAEVREGVDGPDDGRSVARLQTPLTEVEVAVALREGHRMYFLSDPNDARLGVAWAHIALENGRGKETYNNNFGNLGATDAFEGKYYIRYLRERVQRNPDVWKYLRIKFRSYDTPAEGARAYWKVLQDHYGTSLGYMDAGQPFEAAKRLNTGGYATALTEPYVMGVVQLYGEYNSRIGPALASGAKE